MKIKILLFGGLLVLGFACGAGYRHYSNNKTVAIRISQPQKMMDYDLMSSVNFIFYQLEKQGYNVLGISYAGDLYPPTLNHAKYNIFVRAFEPFYDVRLSQNSKNIFYVERFVRQYAEEFVGYDGYITSQKTIQQEMKNQIKMLYLPSMAVFHQPLIPNYQYDVLYIYEVTDPAYEEFLNQYVKNAKIYGGAAFAHLSDKEREQELAKARLVVYIIDEGGKDDTDFVPFAIYDIMSYGRPLLTNFKPSLANDFNNNVFLFKTHNDIANETIRALETPSRLREERAQKARDLLRAKNQDLPDFFN